ncbi:MAG: hypothetical protein M1819_002349 [Sarea resinae]|nr:MAG: hypothetical protein M1819_002349 [Sarea resinae]
MPTPPPPGIYVPVPTFFQRPSSSNAAPNSNLDSTNNNSNAPKTSTATLPLDLATQRRHAVHLARCGIRGLVLLGSTGEAIHLSSAERIAVVGAVRAALDDAGFPDYPLLAGTATQNVAETVQQLAEARTAGRVQWGLVLVPGFFAPHVSAEAVEAWFTEVADRSPVPILIYHYPLVSNNIALGPSTYQHLSTHANIVGAKLSHSTLSHHTLLSASPHPSLAPAVFATFTGLGQMLVGVLAMGGAGAIDGLAGVFPRAYVRLFELYVAWERSQSQSPAPSSPSPSPSPSPSNTPHIHPLHTIRTLQYHIARAEELVLKWGTVGTKEAMARIAGFGTSAAARAPLAAGFPGGGGEAEWDFWAAELEGLRGVEEGLAGEENREKEDKKEEKGEEKGEVGEKREEKIEQVEGKIEEGNREQGTEVEVVVEGVL